MTKVTLTIEVAAANGIRISWIQSKIFEYAKMLAEYESGLEVEDQGDMFVTSGWRGEDIFDDDDVV